MAVNVNSGKDPGNFCDGEESCLVSLISETGNDEYCSYAVNGSHCYKLLAIRDGDINICDRTEDRDKCIFQVAYKLKIPGLCDNGVNSSICYYSFAVASKNITLCENSEKYKNYCIQKILDESS